MFDRVILGAARVGVKEDSFDPPARFAILYFMSISPNSLAETLGALLERRDLSAEQMQLAVSAFMAGSCSEAEMAGFLIALRMKGETALEVASAARVMRAHMVKVDSGRDDAIDTCGTGGDASGTFNISTASSFVVASCGVPVVKGGNRSVSSRCGSADVLEQLGVDIQLDAARARQCLDVAGWTFLFAPLFHPATKHVAGVRRQLKVRTLFNCLGPLVNPAQPAFHLMGVGKLELLDLMAGALAQLGCRHAFVLCSQDGLDEVSLAASTEVREVRSGTVTPQRWQPEDFGLVRCELAEVRVQSAEESAALIESILAGEEGAAGRLVRANAAAALLAAERVASLAEGVSCAREAISSGRAGAVLQRLRQFAADSKANR
ncbi:MAG: anthranilate phosphoribosyltransferase [Gemmataceae bacterium]